VSATSDRPLAGRTIALLEARRSQEITRLIELQGGRAHVAPLLREVPTDDPSLHAWLAALADRRFDVVVFLTGVGCQVLLDRAHESGLLPAVLEGLASARVVARGPKPVRVLKEHGVRVDFVPPEPNTSDELIAELTDWDLHGKTLGLQLYGGTTPYLERLRSGLASLGDRSKRLTRKVVVCLTDRRARVRDVEVLPLREFLAELPA